MRVIHVPGIIACGAEERTDGPFKKRAVSLKLITGLSRHYTIEGIVVEHGHSAANTANTLINRIVKVVVVNFSCPATAPAPIFCPVTLHLRVIHMVVPPDPSPAAKVVWAACWQASQGF
jgi:hypothetical protein